MKKYKAYILLILSFIIFLPLLLYSILCIFPKTTWHGFGVDSNGRIYTGQAGKITVHLNQKTIDTIPIPDYRTYYFTVQEEDTVLIADATEVDIYDLSGNLLDSYKDPGPSKYNELQWTKTIHTSSGDTYRLRSFLGFHTIMKNGETIVYRTSTSDYLLFLLAIFSFMAAMGTCLIMLAYTKTFGKKPENYSTKK